MMIILSFFSVIALLIYLVMVYYTLKLSKTNWPNIAFALICLCFAVYSFPFIYFYTAPSKEQAMFWYRMASIGWTFFPGPVIHFYSLLANKEITKKKWPVLLFYLPGSFFLIYYLFHFNFALDMIFINGTWHAVLNAQDIVFKCFILFMLLFPVTAFIFLMIWRKKSGPGYSRKQSNLLILSMLICYPAIMAVNILLPLFHIYLIPEFAHILSLVFMFVVLYSVINLNMNIFYPSFANEKVISKINDILLLINSEGLILKTNHVLEAILGYPESEMKDNPLERFAEKSGKILLYIHQNHQGNHELVPIEIDFRSKSGESIPVIISSIQKIEHQDQGSYYIIIGHDIRQGKKLDLETALRLKAEENERNYIQQLIFLSKTAMTFVSMKSEDNIYRYIGRKIFELTGDSIILVSSYSQILDAMRVENVTGSDIDLLKLNDIAGSPLDGIHIKIGGGERAELSTGRLMKVNEGFGKVSAGLFPIRICALIEKELKINSVYWIGLKKSGELLGNLVILFKGNQQNLNFQIIEIFLNQATVALQKRMFEKTERKMEEKYRMLVENLNEIIFTIHPNGNVIYISPVVTSILGYTPEELIGKPFINYIYHEDLPGLLESYENTKNGIYNPHEFRIYHKNGTLRFVRTSSRMINNEEGIPEMSGYLLDISDWKWADLSKRTEKL